MLTTTVAIDHRTEPNIGAIAGRFVERGMRGRGPAVQTGLAGSEGYENLRDRANLIRPRQRRPGPTGRFSRGRLAYPLSLLLQAGFAHD